MKFVLKLSLVFILFAIFSKCLACDQNCKLTTRNSTVLSRNRRYVDFLKASRMFFRVNIKEIVLSWSTIWAHASGWKANMNFLNDNKALRPYRRDTYEVLQELMDFHGLDGQACMLKAFCTATRLSESGTPNGVLFKLLRHIFTLNEQDRHHFSYLKDENCDQLMHHHCPLSFNNISPYTDDV